ncbi:MAG: UDP-4-amino-4,6-dideoxy-N-acetyl-beta-L-altrosamine transaminase [Filomicrobium sp.]
MANSYLPNEFLPYGRQDLDNDDIKAVEEVLRGDWLTTGPTVSTFELAFAKKSGAKYAAACANGTAALHLASLAIGLTPTDLVIVPAVTFLATATAPHHVGAEIKFADVDPVTGLMMPEHVEEALAETEAGSVKAIFPMHLGGQCGDPAGIKSLADQFGLRVIEDACHAVGGSYRHNGQTFNIGACAHSDITAFSFHPVKTITSGEGGILTSRSDDLIECVKNLRNHGIDRDPEDFQHHEHAFDASGEAHPWYYEMARPGFNYRLSDIHCALGLNQLKRLDDFVSRRFELVALYRDALADLAPLVRPVDQIRSCDPSWHLFVVHINFEKAGKSRAQLMRDLTARNIGTQVHYIPLHKQPYFARRYGALRLPGAEQYYNTCLSLPLFPSMTDSDVMRVVDALRSELT